jgi:TonB family protein
MMSNEWKLPLNVAIGIHVLVLLAALFLPDIFKAKPKFADIYSVSIINVAEPTVNPAPPVRAPKTVSTPKTSPPPVSAPPEPVKTQKTAPIAEVQEEPAPVPQKAISLKPLKKKKIQKIKPAEDLARKQEDLNRKEEIVRNNRQKLAEALREEELLAERAKLAQEALDIERSLLQSQQPADDLPTRSSADSENQASSSSAAAGSNSSHLESQYLASVFNRLHQFWAPPEYLQQDPTLTSVVVITINQDGKIANMLFESKSGDRVFDQFVNKTIEAADPMPPIPPALKKKRFEIGLRFRPGSIQ